jgi:hypothetical protein
MEPGHVPGFFVEQGRYRYRPVTDCFAMSSDIKLK